MAEAIEYRASQKKKKQGVRKVKPKAETNVSVDKEIIKTEVNEVANEETSTYN